MNRLLRHRIFAILLLLAVLTPYAVQASHTLENHEHEVCTAKDVKHFHAQEFDCSIFHTPIENHSNGVDLTFEVLTNKKFDHYFKTNVQPTSLGFLSLKSSRAPPSFIV